MTQRKRWLKTREFEKGECVAVRRPGKADTDRNAKRPPFVCVLVWVYFVHERFESGFRDLTLCVKVLRVCWHSRRSKAYRGLSEARMAEATVEETAFEDVNMWQAHPLTHTMCHTPHWASAGQVAFYYFVFLKRRKCIRGHFLGFLASAVVLRKGFSASAGESAGIRACVGRYVNQNGCFSGPCLATLLPSRNRKGL